MISIGIDLGGTKIESIAIDESGHERQRHRVKTPHSYRDTIDAIAELVQAAATGAHASDYTVGVGIPGAVMPSTGLVKNANSTWLIGKPLPADLSRRLSRPVTVMNDANCFALSEATDGAGAGAPVVFGVILGTGVGGGIVVGGQCLVGPNLISGEWGHNPLPWPRPDELPGPACYCGKTGCIETWLSGTGIARDHETVTGEAKSGAEVARAAADGDAAAKATLARHAERLGRALASVINLLDPDVIVLGGGVSNIPGLAETAYQHLLPWTFSAASDTRVVRNQHGDSSGVRGAAWIGKSGLPNWNSGTASR